MFRSTCLAFGLLYLLTLAGCSNGEAQVSGFVRLNGEPLAEGDIIFEETDKSKTPAAGKIVAGKYELKVLPGNKTVRINASRPTAKPDPLMGAAARESAIAKEFNERSTLKAEIKSGENKDVNFDVKPATTK
ncbi:MAG: hypothetical protein U0744_17580 [Gemmataceae bacterium]